MDFDLANSAREQDLDVHMSGSFLFGEFGMAATSAPKTLVWLGKKRAIRGDHSRDRVFRSARICWRIFFASSGGGMSPFGQGECLPKQRNSR